MMQSQVPSQVPSQEFSDDGWVRVWARQPQCMEQLVGKYKLVNIVLGTVSRDPSAAWFVDALHVLKLLLSKLGRSLWIDSSFPPETVRAGPKRHPSATQVHQVGSEESRSHRQTAVQN
jgi:hypothetical protein